MKLIILSQGRSGSTFVQRVINNSLPDTCIYGENEGFWNHIHTAYTKWGYTDSMNVKGEYHNDNYKPEWWNPIDQSFLKSEINSMFDRIYRKNGCKIYGFKEIRIPENLDLFMNMFQDCKFIFTTRKIEALIKSGWWKEKDRQMLLNIEGRLKAKALQFNDKCYHLAYENMNEKGFCDMFEWLGETPDMEKLRNTIKNKL